LKKFILFTISAVLSLSLLFTACGKGKDLQNDNDGTITGTGNTQTDENSKGSSNEDLKVSDFFPFTKDMHMKYKGIGNEYAEFETYVEFIRDNLMQVRNINPGTSLAIVYELKDGELRKIFNKGEVYYRYDYTASAGEKEVLLKEPIKEGTSWTLKDGIKRSITAIDKKIETPAGEYPALEVTTEEANSVTTDYYVKNLGHVKKVYKSKDSDFTVISELEKAESGVPYKERIIFYYPDFNKDKLAYVEKEIELFTNTDMKDVFKKEFRNIPKNSSLSKVISENTRILKIVLNSPSSNDVNQSVIADFSSQLVTEMNAGTSLESMILSSITNTFGNYYQTQKVGITLDGKPYESGHVLMKQDEYFTVDTKNTYEYK